MFDEITKYHNTISCFSQFDPPPYWNYTYITTPPSMEDLSYLETYWQRRNRAMTFYFENTPENKNIKSFLSSHKFSHHFEDSWMFYEGKILDKTHFESIKEVRNEKDLADFIYAFDNSYQEGDPQNAYGRLNDYLPLSEQAWRKHKDTDKLHYYVAYKDGKPVAVSALTLYKDIGYLSNIGSLPSARGQGYGKAVTLFAVKESVKRGHHHHVLATEQGTYANDFYQRLGFKTHFSAVAFTTTHPAEQ